MLLVVVVILMVTCLLALFLFDTVANVFLKKELVAGDFLLGSRWRLFWLAVPLQDVFLLPPPPIPSIGQGGSIFLVMLLWDVSSPF